MTVRERRGVAMVHTRTPETAKSEQPAEEHSAPEPEPETQAPPPPAVEAAAAPEPELLAPGSFVIQDGDVSAVVEVAPDQTLVFHFGAATGSGGERHPDCAGSGEGRGSTGRGIQGWRYTGSALPLTLPLPWGRPLVIYFESRAGVLRRPCCRPLAIGR